MTDKIDIDELRVELSLATINLTGKGDEGILALFEKTTTALANMKAREDVLKYKLETISKCLVGGHYKTAVNYANGYLDSQGTSHKGDEL